MKLWMSCLGGGAARTGEAAELALYVVSYRIVCYYTLYQLYYIVLFHTILYHNIILCIILYYIVLDYIIFYDIGRRGETGGPASCRCVWGVQRLCTASSPTLL